MELHTSDSAAVPAFAAARAICQRHAKSFYFASYFLPPARRAAAYAVYAFCRLLDDAIDQPDEPASLARPTTLRPSCFIPNALESRLTEFQNLLDQIYKHEWVLLLDEPPSESQWALYAFAQTVHQYSIPRQFFLDLIEGCRMDLSISRYATWAALEKYCYHVAGVVGLIMSAIFGLKRASAADQAVLMGNAMQLTNILRDIKEDRDRGRIYLPLTDMAQFGYSEKDLTAGVVNENFRELMRFEIGRARDLYRRGAEGLCCISDANSRLTASAMGTIYAGILDAIERQRYDVFSSRAHLTKPQKLARLPAAWRLAKREHDEPLPRVF